MEQDRLTRDEGRGRSARKRAAKQIEEHARRLVELSEADLKRLTLPADVAAELKTARQTRGHSSQKRAIKYLAGLLRRDEEVALAVAEFLAGQDAARYQEAARFHNLEAWRDRLCDPVTAPEAIRFLGEVLDSGSLRQLRQASRAACAGDKTAARKVFRLLRAAELTDAPEGFSD